MKTAIKLGGLAVVIFLASCANDVRIVKRKYNSGYYVSTSSKTNHQAAVTSVKSTVKENAVGQEELNPITETVEMPVTASADNSIVPVVKKNFFPINQSQKIEPTVKHIDVTLSAKEQKKAAKIEKKAEKAATRIAKKQRKPGTADTNLVLEVILCFFPFLNLIAIYLKDGNKLTNNFWIDLLLDFLFFFPGIIFALLVVLDVINLG